VLRGLLTKDPAHRMTAEQARQELQAALDGTREAPSWSPPAQSAQHPDQVPEDDRVERIDAADLRALAAASATLIGAVARDARQQAHHLAERRREKRQQVRQRQTAPPEAPAPAGADRPARRPEARPDTRTRRRRFRRRWVVVPVLVVVLVLLAVAAGLVVLLGNLVGWY
jgi:hypothetical protein